MALQVYLPLNGNLNQTGLSSMTFSNLNSSNTYVDSGGTFGNCYRNNSNTDGGLVSNIAINLGQKQSMCCWFKIASLTSNSSLGGTLISQHRYPNNTGLGLTIKYVSSTTGYLSVNTGNGSSRTFNTYCCTTLLQANTWYHACYTYDNGTLKIYLNGNCEYTGNIGVQSVPSDFLTIFGWSFGSSTTTDNTVYSNYKLNGWLADVRMYDHTLSASEVAVIAGTYRGGLEVWLPLNGNLSNQGYVHSTITATSASVASDGKLGQCYSFSSTANNAIKGTFPATSTDISFCIWVKFNSFSAGMHLLDCRDGDAHGYQPMYVDSTRIQCGRGANNVGSFPDISYSFAANTWYHIAVVHNSSGVKVYINGTLAGSNSESTGVNFNQNFQFCIGSRFTGTNPLNGYVNDFRIYSRALSADEVKNIARGLMFRYPLNNNGFGNLNLVPAANNYTSATPWTTSLANMDGYSWVTNSAFEGEVGATYTISVQCDGNLASGHVTTGVSPSNKYWTLWLYVCNTGNTNWRNGVYDSAICLTNSNYNHRKVGNTHIWTYTMTGTQKYISIRTNSYSDGSTVLTLHWWNFKIEKGDGYTFYTPYFSDILQSIIGIREWPVHYDKTVYTESDGSKWIHLVHHNNPAAALFSSTDSFSTGVYKSSDVWYDAEPSFAKAPRYEFMVKQKLTSDASEVKYRWIQTANPLTATWADVQPGTVTNITTSGYTNGGQGGLWRMNSNTRLVIANASSGNWFGALGSWTAYSGGIPGYPNTAVTSGYIDLYMRIDTPTEYDTSGMGNNGILNTVGMTYSSNTPKGRVSTYFDGTNEVIQIPNLSTFIASDGIFTFNVWFYKDSWGSDSWETILGGPSGFELEGKLSTSTNAYVHPYSWGGGSTSTPNSYSIPYSFGAWHMITMVRTPSDTKFYLDGVLKVTGTAGTIPSGNYYIGSWRDADSQNYKGYMSDARMYSTALSADDVLLLYQNKI